VKYQQTSRNCDEMLPVVQRETNELCSPTARGMNLRTVGMRHVQKWCSIAEVPRQLTNKAIDLFSEEVKFQEGLCATPSVCRDFCRAVFADDLLGPITRQCQHQCCNSAGCNYIRQ